MCIKLMMPTRGMGVGSSFWRRVVIFVSLFDYLFVFQLSRWVIILFLSLTSGWGFLFFLFFLFCFVLFFLQNVQFPHHISRVRLIFFLSHRLVKFFAFFYFCLFVFIFFFFGFVFCFLFCFQQFHPPWYQMVRPYPYSITQIMVDITSSTILNSRAIQWKM